MKKISIILIFIFLFNLTACGVGENDISSLEPDFTDDSMVEPVFSDDSIADHNAANTTNEPADDNTDTDTPETSSTEASPIPEGELSPASTTPKLNANMEISIAPKKESFKQDEFVTLVVTLANTGNCDAVFVLGSSSNILPEAITLKAGNLVPMFYPLVENLNFSVDSVEPQQSISYEISFAPYTGTKEIDPTTTIETLSKDASFSPAAKGAIEITANVSWQDTQSLEYDLYQLQTTAEIYQSTAKSVIINIV